MYLVLIYALPDKWSLSCWFPIKLYVHFHVQIVQHPANILNVQKERVQYT